MGITRPNRYEHYILVVLVVTYSINFMDRQILNILLPLIKAEILLTDTQLGLLSGIAFALFYSTLGLPIARWADRANRVKIISLAIGLWSIMTALSGTVTSFFQLFIARIGVGVGEAGCTPPAHSLISDYFPKERRSTAMSIYSLGIPIGSVMGLILGGWIGQLYGWRTAFMAVGIPGIILALLVRFTVKEPERGKVDGIESPEEDFPGLMAAVKMLWVMPSFRQVTFASSLLAFAGFAGATWIPSFLYRSHGMDIGEIGTWLASITLVGGVSGSLLGGVLGDNLGKRNVRWYVWIPAIAMIIGIPFTVLGLLATTKLVVVLAFTVTTMVSTIYLGPVFSLIQRMVGLRMRALASATFLFFTNLIGMGGGPLAVGLISDFAQKYYGGESLRYSLLFGVVINAWSALHYWLASKSLVYDLEVKDTYIKTT